MRRHRSDYDQWPRLTHESIRSLPREQIVLFRDPARVVRWALLRDIQGIPFSDCLPLRTASWHRHQEHLPGFYWFSKTRELVLYESLLERAHLTLLDFEPRVRWVKAQPFGLRIQLGAAVHLYTPDYLVCGLNGRQHVLEVKPAVRRARPEWTQIERAMRVACEIIGWAYDLADDPDPTMLETVRWLAGFRRPVIDTFAFAERILGECGRPISIGELARSQGAENEAIVRPLVFHLIWSHQLHIDLMQPLEDTTVVTREGREACDGESSTGGGSPSPV